MAYATDEELRLFMRHPAAFTADETAQANLALDLASGAIDDETGQGDGEPDGLLTREDDRILDGPTRADRWHTPPGLGSRELVLPRWPVTAVASVTLLHDDREDEVLSEGTDADYVWSASGILTRIGAWWPHHPRLIQVVYTAGYASITAGVKRIALRLAAEEWDNPGALKSEQLGDHSRSWGGIEGAVLSPADLRILGAYRART